jgi:hypothetical protein
MRTRLHLVWVRQARQKEEKGDERGSAVGPLSWGRGSGWGRAFLRRRQKSDNEAKRQAETRSLPLRTMTIIAQKDALLSECHSIYSAF